MYIEFQKTNKKEKNIIENALWFAKSELLPRHKLEDITIEMVKEFEIDAEVQEGFTGHNTEIYDCVVCCNPNRLSYEVYDGEITSLTVSDGNE